MRISTMFTFTAATAALTLASRPAEALDSGLGDPLWTAAENTSEPELEYRYKDVRVRFDSGEGTWAADISPSFTTTEYREGTIDTMRSLRLDLVGSSHFTTRGGMVWGGGLEVDRWQGTLMTNQAAFGVAAVNLYAGYGFAIGTQAQLELVAIGQLGAASIEDTFPGVASPRLEGAHLGLGAEANLVLLRQSGWHVAGSVGARYAESHLSNDDFYSAKLRSQGLTAGISIGRRF